MTANRSFTEVVDQLFHAFYDPKDIPKTVTAKAKVLGVSQPALSKLRTAGGLLSVARIRTFADRIGRNDEEREIAYRELLSFTRERSGEILDKEHLQAKLAALQKMKTNIEQRIESTQWAIDNYERYVTANKL